ncbi:hypothetical protein M407DRAFT_23798 [Tulasnella calospora MUT 4182]|uniref:Protein kinase domain-containing protein n=1 Tax=Tulasnella calospora MUT 4182 TaxID=1051891 RepID=A0A0C3M001_9AGAM|nr:hypothetical protein M407DRAFT_23798 [Tulasnella calospora MUT 4182]
MQKFISKLSKPLQGTRFWHPFSPLRTSLADEHANEARGAGAQQGPSPDAAEETTPRKLSARERLGYLSHLRTSLSAINFISSTSYQGGGKAKVVQAIVRRGVLRKKKIVAVKKMNYHKDMKIPKFSNEFVHEIEILAGLVHENVVRLIGFVEQLEKGEAWIVLSWHPNGNVSEFLATGEWEIPERVSLIKDTFEGLAYLHSRKPPICHGDLKSFNILVSSSYRAIITDFGSARVLDKLAERVVPEDRGQTTRWNPTTEEAKIRVGTTGNQLTLTGPSWSLRWAPPEVVNGATTSLSSDIWSAGWVCWEIMTNQVPFPELDLEGVITLMVIQGKVPSTREEAQLSQITGLCSLMTDCWEFDPVDRPDVAQCQNEVAWMPSIPPSGVRVPSLELLLEMGKLHLSHGRYKKAALLFQQALAVAQLAGGSEAIANALSALGKTYFFQTKYSEAEKSLIRAQKIYALTGNDHETLRPKSSSPKQQQIWTRIGNDHGRAKALHGLGSLYRSQTKYSEAEESLLHAQQIFTRIGNDKRRANALCGLGELYRLQTKYSEAEESLLQAQHIFTRIGDDHGRANALQGLGDLYYLQTKDSEAEELFVQAQQIWTHIGNDHGRANALHGLGSLYRSQTKYSEAEESLLQAQQIFTRIGNDIGRADALRGLGDLYRALTKYSEAEESLILAGQIYTRTGNDQGRANALHGLGDLYYLQNKDSEAEESFVQAQQIYTRIGNDHGRANVFQGLGGLYRSQTKYSEAEESLLQAQQIFTRIDNDQGRADALRGLGELYRSQTKYSEAAESFVQAQQIYTRLGDDLGRANTLRGLGHLHLAQGRNVKSASFYAEARDLYARLGRLDDQEDASRRLATVSQERYSS